jgi:DNA-binding NarL/FixJ family response regulator
MPEIVPKTPTPAAVTAVLVERNPTVRHLLTLQCADAGILVLAAVGTLGEGRLAITGCQPDVAVIDDRLPDGRGVDLCRTLAVEEPEITLLLHTGVLAADDVREALDAGAAAVVLRTIRAESLLDMIKRRSPR